MPQYLGIGKRKEDMIEPVTATLFLKGLFTKKTAVKSLAFGFWIAIFIGIVYFGFMLWQKIMQETESYHQEAQQITNYEYHLDPKQTFSFFGCNNLRIDEKRLKAQREGTQKIEKTK